MKNTLGDLNNQLHIWSAEEKEHLKIITPGHSYKEIRELMNKKFDYDYTIDQIKNAIKRYKLSTGHTGRFEKGHTPANKGTKGVIYEGCKKTWFKKGSIPVNYRPVGSERVNADGYLEIKIAEPNKWKLKHKIIYEKQYGTVPKGYVVIFGDSDKSNLDINNLILVSRKQLLMMNRNKLIQGDADLTRTGVIIADLYSKISERRG